MKEMTRERGYDKPGRAPAPWDYYYLRYFLGAVVGAGLLLALWTGRFPGVLSSFPLPAASHEWLDLAAAVTALGTAGLASAMSPVLQYCCSTRSDSA